MILDHGLEYLGGHDDRFGASPGELDGALLHQRHLLQRELDAEVTAGDHHAVERGDDLLEILDCLRLLDLGDHGQANALLVHDLVDPFDICGVTHERQGDHVRLQPQRPAEVRLVLLRHGWDADRDPGQVDALVVGHHPALDHHGDHVGVVNLESPQGDLAVIDEQHVPGAHVAGKPLVGRRHPVLVTEDVIDRDGEARTVDQRDRSVGEAARADLGALQVDQNAHGTTPLVTGLAHLGIHRLMVGVAPMREVEPGNVHPGGYQRPHSPHR